MKSVVTWNWSRSSLRVALVVAAVGPWLLPAAASADDWGTDEMRARLERLEAENDQLRLDLEGLRRLPEFGAPQRSAGGPIEPAAMSRSAEPDPDAPALITKDDLDKELSPFKGLKGVKVGMTTYLDYSFGVKPEFDFENTNYNLFSVTRGYLTVEKELTPWFHARVTPDVHQDSSGDWKLRLKYTYAELRPHDFGFLTGMKSELGLGHMPWLDFEEHVNPYRCQGTMAIERAGVFNSADLGVSLRGDFGGKLACAEEWVGSTHYDGRYGSWHVGVYNGAGYHGIEENGNKPFEGRITLRPLPDCLPGLQLSYFGIVGLGNTDYAEGWPDYDVNMAMLSYQKPWLVLTGQYFTARGNAAGTWVDAQGRALDTEGYSFFANLRLPTPRQRLWLFSRYDHFNQDVDDRIASNADYDMYIGGLAYYIYKQNLVMLVYENTDYGSGANKKGSAPDPTRTNLGRDQKGQLVFQISF